MTLQGTGKRTRRLHRGEPAARDGPRQCDGCEGGSVDDAVVGTEAGTGPRGQGSRRLGFEQYPGTHSGDTPVQTASPRRVREMEGWEAYRSWTPAVRRQDSEPDRKPSPTTRVNGYQPLTGRQEVEAVGRGGSPPPHRFRWNGEQARGHPRRDGRSRGEQTEVDASQTRDFTADSVSIDSTA